MGCEVKGRSSFVLGLIVSVFTAHLNLSAQVQGPVVPVGGDEFVIRGGLTPVVSELESREAAGRLLELLMSVLDKDEHIVNTQALCDSLLSDLPGGFVSTLSDIGSLLGLCDSAGDLIAAALPGIQQKLAARCEGYSNSRSADPGDGPFEGKWVTTCTYTPPNITPTCGGLYDWCMSTEAWIGINKPDTKSSFDPDTLLGGFKIPGCNCEITFEPTQIDHIWKFNLSWLVEAAEDL